MTVEPQRRLILAAGLTLAMGIRPGKPAAQTVARPPIATPVVPPAGEGHANLEPMSGLIPRDPPTPPPEIGFTDGDGAPHALAEFRGKGLIVNLWATWCVPCVAEMPALQQMSRTLASAGILVLPLSSDRGGAPIVRRFYAAHDIQFPVWLDPKGAAARAWGARGLPTTLIIDRQGREQGRMEGAVDWASPDSLATIKRLVG